MENLTLMKCEVRKNGLLLNDALSFEEWIDTGKKLRLMESSVHFWIGDWLNYGEHKFGEMYAQAFDTTQYSYKTLANDKWIASRIPVSLRRENLTFTHHGMVAALEPEDQKVLLDQAEKEKMTTAHFRKLVYRYTLNLELPELTKEQIDKGLTPTKDFDDVQGVINSGLEFLESLERVMAVPLSENAKDYLFSHLRDVVKIVGSKIVGYEEQKHNPASLEGEKQAQKEDAAS